MFNRKTEICKEANAYSARSNATLFLVLRSLICLLRSALNCQFHFRFSTSAYQCRVRTHVHARSSPSRCTQQIGAYIRIFIQRLDLDLDLDYREPTPYLLLLNSYSVVYPLMLLDICSRSRKYNILFTSLVIIGAHYNWRACQEPKLKPKDFDERKN